VKVLSYKASRSKDELITKQDKIIAKQNQEKAAQEAQLRDKEQWLQHKDQLLQQQTQKATDLSLQLTQQKLGQKEEMLNTKWFEIEQLKTEWEGNKAKPELPILKPEKPLGRNFIAMLFQPEPKKVLSVPEQVEQMSSTAKEQNKIHQEEVLALLKWVTEGHLVEVETILKKNQFWGLPGSIKDLSDRTFKNITALQYAAWSLDREMCGLIMGYLGTHNSAIQLKALYAEPNRYSDYGTHYDIKPLIEKTQTYVKNKHKWRDENPEECSRYWQKEVEGEQRKCPAWLIYAWSEEGKDVAWTTQDFTRKVKREYDKNRLDWWFTDNFNNGRGVESTWGAARGGKRMDRSWGTSYRLNSRGPAQPGEVRQTRR